MRPKDRAKLRGPFGPLRRRWWKAAMMRAIHAAAGNNRGCYKNKIHPINGLRVIRLFEQINGVHFNPFNPLHVSTVSDMRPLIALWSLRRNLERIKFACAG